ncbi:MAG: pyridoxal phosphate-dependent decarboxylase family protein [Candidatus Hodarchaeales archaeon]|jgi:glutamate/tyrosine decarboxylase-like PLP-dependent enzyme
MRSKDTLQLSREEMQLLGYQVVDILVDHFDNLHDKFVTHKANRSSIEKRLREPLPEKGTLDFGMVLQQLQQDVLSNIMHPDHPRFFAFVPGPSNFISVMADTIATGFNVFAGTWLEASGPTEIELVTIDWLRQLCGLPSTTSGLFVSGGSIANLTALAIARHVKLDNQVQGAVIYFSDQTHSSIDKGLALLGFKLTQLRRLASDDDYKLKLSELRQEIAKDRKAGRKPFCVIANAGTVNTGAVDPLLELVDLCCDEGLWLHVDGAYGAPAVLSDKGRDLLEGLDRVDSLTLDPHKWLFQPYEIGCLLVKNGHLLKETFRILPEYLKDVDRAEEEVNYCDLGIQLTRRFRALKLWMSLKVFGIDAFRKAITRGIEKAEKAEEMIKGFSNWEVVTPAQMAIVTFRYTPEDHSPEELNKMNRQLVDRMIADGYAMISTTELRGQTVLRLCMINPRTTETDIQETIKKLDKFGEELRDQMI